MSPAGARLEPSTRDGYVDEDQDGSLDSNQLRHLLHAPARRPLLVVVPWVAILILSMVAFFLLPKRYKSSTLIMVESEKVPDSFVAKVSTGDRGQSFQTIWPEVQSRTRLERVLEETHPYPEMDSTTGAVERLRRSISINMTGNDGFTLEVVHADPHKAQEVANRVATLFIEETIKAREAQVVGAVDFLVAQVADARKELEIKDETLRRYKEAHMGRLPEQLQTNLTTLQMLQQELQTVEERLILTRERRDALARGARNPSGAAGAEPDELQELRGQLATMRDRYTEEHPDVQRLKSRIARLEERRAAIPAEGALVPHDPSSQLATDQFNQALLEVKKLEDRRADLDTRVAALRARVEETPRTEQELINLQRDYNKLNENYAGLLSKQLEAQMAGRLEQRWKGDRFRMLDPANLPERPYFPKPALIIGLGAVLGLFVGLGAAIAAELADTTIKDAADLESVLTHPLLARISHIPSLGGPWAR